MKKLYLRGNIFLKIIKIILAIIVVALYAYQLITTAPLYLKRQVKINSLRIYRINGRCGGGK
ncbi:hypothetical protein ACJEBK_13395 [Peribacillus frigoritolerans]|uniref:hypothetical protein n=1 Tax=Peribacillus TaxID=2675229 RepID=UPI001140CC9D|nr:hypothetical protein [Peribacillus simplex]